MAEYHRQSGATARGSEGRGEGGRGASSGLRASFRETGALRIPLASAAKVHRAADLTRAKAERHYEKHKDAWVAKAYTKLLLRAAPTLSLTPPGMASDPKTAMLSRAGREVAHRQSQRLARIDRAKTAMLNGGAVRPTRKMEWGKGLGD